MNAIVQASGRELLANGDDIQALAAALPGGCPKLTQALSEARDRCLSAPKTGRNKFHGYDYARADDVIATGRKALNGSGLSLVPHRYKVTVEGSGNLAFYALNSTFILSHSSGEFLPIVIEGWPVVPEKGRPLDKAVPIALTSSFAYLYCHLLMMERGSEEDVAAQDDRNTPAPPEPAEAARAKQTPAAETVSANEANHRAAALATVEAARQERYGSKTPSVETLSPEQQDALAVVYRDRKRTPQDMVTLLASRGVHALQQLPKDCYEWAHAILADGQIDQEQSDRIAALVTERGFAWQDISKRLQKKFGVDRLKLLTRPQADEIEQALKPKEAPAPV